MFSRIFRKAPKQILEGIIDVIKKPPQRAIEIWGGLSEGDQELFKKAAISGARLAARAIITADKGKKMKF